MNDRPPLPDLPTPYLLLREDRLERNLRRGQELARAAGVGLRPHAKTHKNPGIAHRQLRLGACGITVATIREAEEFCRHGVTDVFIARPVLGRDDLDLAGNLLRQNTLRFAIDHPVHVDALKTLARTTGSPAMVRIEIDSGQHRCGLTRPDDILHLAGLCVEAGLHLEGVFTHAGHAYGAVSAAQVQDIARQEGQAVLDAAAILRRNGFSCPVVSTGSTPTLFLGGILAGVTEIRPGNYVFFDAMQIALGTATPDDCALSVVARVIGVYPTHIVIDAGSKSLGLDKGAHGTESVKGYGFLPFHPGGVIERLSEEHGIITLPPGSRPAPGSLLEIVPNHSCAAANLFAGCITLNASGHTSFEAAIGKR